MNIIFWLLVLIIGASLGIFVFLLVGSIKNKAHDHPEAKKVMSIIIGASVMGMLIFSWNTYNLFYSLENFGNLPSIKSTQQTKPDPKSKTDGGVDSNYINF